MIIQASPATEQALTAQQPRAEQAAVTLATMGIDVHALATDQWPNPPWNVTSYDWYATYATCTPEWYAQQTAWGAVAFNLQYSMHDPYAEQAARTVDAAPATPAPAARDQDQPGQGQPPRKRNIPAPVGTGPLKIQNAVLAGDYLYTVTGGKLRKIALAADLSFSDVLELAATHNARTLWIMGTAAASDQATEDYINAAGDSWKIIAPQYVPIMNTQAQQAGLPIGTELCQFLLAAKRDRQAGEEDRTIGVGFSARAYAWGLEMVSDPVTLLTAITYLEDATGAPVQFSPGSVGRKLAEKSLWRNIHKEWTRPIDVPAGHPITTKATAPRWLATLDGQAIERLHAAGRVYPLAYDKNSMYPASCTGVKLGAGLPEHIVAPVDFDLKNPQTGVYYCELSGVSEWNGYTLPHPTNGECAGWFWSYTVKLAIECGYQVNIKEAYIWRETHTPFRKWVETLWSARESLNASSPDCNRERYKHADGLALAYKAVKSILNNTLGLFDHEREREQAAGDKWTLDQFRPDWYAMIIDRAKYLMFTATRRAHKDNLVTPIGILTDCLYVLAPTSDHNAALPGMLDRKYQLGGYKEKCPAAGLTLQDIEFPLMAARVDIGEVNAVFLRMEEEKTGIAQDIDE